MDDDLILDADWGRDAVVAAIDLIGKALPGCVMHEWDYGLSLSVAYGGTERTVFKAARFLGEKPFRRDVYAVVEELKRG